MSGSALHTAGTVALWVAFGVGLVALGDAVRLRRRRDRTATRTGLLGLFIVLDTLPRMAGAPSAVTLALSVVAFGPLVLMLRTGDRAPGPKQD